MVQPSARPALLLVDDDASLLTPLARRFSADGFDVRTAASGADAIRALDEGWPSLVVIDLMMPGMDGIELAQRIKRIADLPIIVVSAVTADDSKISALEDFAEDYVTKPFVYEELAARVHRVLRRAGTGTPQLSIDDGELIIDLVNRQVSSQGVTASLTRIEVRFLQVLIAAVGRTVSTESILSKVWPESDGADPSYVWVTVRRLRHKLEVDPDRPRYLVTDRGVGYRLEASRSTTLHAR